MKFETSHERKGRTDARTFIKQERKERPPNRIDDIRRWLEPHMNTILEDYHNHDWNELNELYEHLETAVSLSLLFPEHRDQLQIDNNLWHAGEAYVAVRGDLHIAAMLTLLFPEKRQDLRIPEIMKPEDYSLHYSGLPEMYSKQENQFTTSLQRTLDCLIVYPEHRDQLGLHALEEAIQQKPGNLQNKDKISLHYLADIRLLLPQHDFSQLASQLFKRYQSDPATVDEHFSRFIACGNTNKFASLAILVADHLELDAQGIHLKMDTPPQEQRPLPQRSIV